MTKPFVFSDALMGTLAVLENLARQKNADEISDKSPVADARWLLQQDGPEAVGTARTFTGRAISSGDRDGARYWGRVASEIERMLPLATSDPVRGAADSKSGGCSSNSEPTIPPIEASSTDKRADVMGRAVTDPEYFRHGEDAIVMKAAMGGSALDTRESSKVTEVPCRSRRRYLVAREPLFLEDAPVEGIYELSRGKLLLLRSLQDGRRQIIDVVGPGRLFGLTNDTTHDCSAIAATSCTVIVRNLNARHRYPEITDRVISDALKDIKRLRELSILLGRKTAVERVATFLLAMTDGDHLVSAEIALPMTRGEIADHLGLTTETISRNMTLLKRTGLIVDRVGGLLLPDCPRLARIAEGRESPLSASKKQT